MNHYTDQDGYNAIKAQPTWRFKASQPPGIHPYRVYFTTLEPDHPKLAKKLRVPKEKLEYVFRFVDAGDLMPLPGGRGQYVFYSPTDYEVDASRQTYAGKA